MSDLYLHEENLVLQALRQNWDHARHVESQRLQSTFLYVATAFGLGFVALHPGDMVLRLGATLLGLSVTLIFWAIIHKLNGAFVVQIWYADRCARHLGIRPPDGKNDLIALHAYLGFPRKAGGQFAVLRRINVRLMYNALYGAFALSWLFLLGYLVFRIIVAEGVL
jgi:hypothetical protein